MKITQISQRFADLIRQGAQKDIRNGIASEFHDSYVDIWSCLVMRINMARGTTEIAFYRSSSAYAGIARAHRQLGSQTASFEGL